MTDRITLTGLTVRGFHGVLPRERQQGQDFVIDVVLHVDTAAAAAGDDLAATVNYADLAARVEAVVAGDPVDLIETLADRIAEVALTPGEGMDPYVSTVEVTVHKPHAPIPAVFGDVSVTVRRHRWARVVVAMGANLGDRAAALESAVEALSATPGVRVEAVSPVYETEPVGGPEQGAYLNAVALLTTRLDARAFLGRLQEVEASHGRTREVRWGPRTLDLDVIRFGDLVSDDPGLTLPHPRVHERAFVLVPWSRVDPDADLPGHGRVADLAVQVADRDGVRVWEESS